MVNEKNIKIILYAGLVISLFCYHILAYFQEKYLHIAVNNTANLFTISRILVSAFLLFILLQWSWIVEIFLGKAYVSGNYKGISIQKGHPTPIQYIEEFSISQSLLSTKISGRSTINGGPLVSSWKGVLINYDSDREFRFAIELHASAGVRSGILLLSINEDREVAGFYSPVATDKMEYVSTFQAAIVKKKVEAKA